MAIVSGILLSGCAANGLVTPSSNMDNVEFKFTGVPIALGMQGTSVRLNERWVLTAKHNKFILFDDLIDHPVCDISVYRDDGELDSPMRAVLPKPGGSVIAKGYAGWFAIPSEGKGKLVQYVHVSADLDLATPSCYMASIDAPLWGGMSGGGTFTEDGNLVGVNSIIYHDGFVAKEDNVTEIKLQERYSGIVPVCTEQVHSWLKEVTGESFCEETIKL
ncbi:hypothetical protein LMH73_022385 [Vibrio splendidus]